MNSARVKDHVLFHLLGPVQDQAPAGLQAAWVFAALCWYSPLTATLHLHDKKMQIDIDYVLSSFKCVYSEVMINRM